MLQWETAALQHFFSGLLDSRVKNRLHCWVLYLAFSISEGMNCDRIGKYKGMMYGIHRARIFFLEIGTSRGTWLNCICIYCCLVMKEGRLALFGRFSSLAIR